jgi:hypothetical protein
MNTPRGFLRGLLGLALVLALVGTAQGEDKDKRRLFNTFFLDGDRFTYMLVFRADRTYELYGPEGQRATGKFAPSDDEVGLFFPGGLRHFSYEFTGTDVVLKPSKKDQPRGGDLVGSMPPIGQDSKRTFISTANWQKRGLPMHPPGGLPVAPQPEPAVNAPATPATPVAPAPPAVPAVAVPAVPAAAGAAPAQVAGTYAFTDAQGRTSTLRLREGGTFDFTPPDGQKTGGNYLYVNGELSLDSGFWRRHLLVASQADGLQISRRDTDVPKLGDALGEMAPVERVAVVWKRQADAAVGANPAPVLPPITPPVEVQTPDLPKVTVTPPVEVKTPDLPKVTVAPPVEVKTPAPRPPVVADLPKIGAAKSLADLAGTYTHRPNPLVSETWILQPDGKFEYKDSNGASISGTAQLAGETLKLQAGEVTRTFAVAPAEGGALVLSRSAEDNPRILNDLASMSPSVLKSAQYEKQR